jgi:hypothetical protein
MSINALGSSIAPPSPNLITLRSFNLIRAETNHRTAAMAAHNSPKISNTSFKFVVPGRRKVAFLALVIRVSALIQINAGGDGETSRWRDARCGRALRLAAAVRR